MSGVDFTQLLRGGGSNLGDAFKAGVDQRRADDEFKRKIAAQEQAVADQKAARTGIAAALATGDYSKAAAQAALYGDDKSATVLAGLGKDGFERAGKVNETLANTYNKIGELPYEMRKQTIQALRPFLVAQGADGAALDAYDPTDANNHAFAARGYTFGEQVKDRIAQQGADTGTTNAQTNRIVAENPVVVGQSLVTRGGAELYRSPQYLNAPAGNNVIEVDGTTANGYKSTTKYAPNSVSAEQLYRNAIEPQESGGRAGAVGPQTRYGRALGASQMLPATAAAMAKKLGLPYREDLMRAKTPEGLDYQRKLGIAYTQTALDATGGDPQKAAEFYHGGPDTRIHGPKTRAYGAQVMSRLDRVTGAQPLNRQTRVIQQGIPAGAAKAQSASAQDQRAIDSTDQAIRSAETLLNHPGLPSAVGSHFDPQSYGRINPLTGKPFAGTDAANFTARLDTLKAQTFLPQVQALRGLGALSDAEGKKLTDAVGALDTNMSESEFKGSLSQVIADLKFFRDRAAKRLAQGGSTQTSASNIPAAAAQMLRQNPALRDAFEAKYGPGSAAQVLGQ